MMQTEAVATLPGLICVEEDLDADRLALVQLAEWAQRFSPVVGLEDAIAPTCLFLDTTGCDACFGGEERMIQAVCEAFAKNGWCVVVVLADTLGAAWGISHLLPSPSGVSGEEGELRNPPNSRYVLIPRNEHPAFLCDLPPAALRLSERTLTLLTQLGIQRVGQLMMLPRDQLAERFGAEVGLRLDQALGHVAEVITPFHPEPDASASWRFDDPIERREVLAKAIDLLLERLQAVLQKRCCGTRLLECTLELDGADAIRFECSLSRPARTAHYLRSLLNTRLEQIRIEAPVRGVCVRAVVLEKIPDDQQSLFDADEAGDEALAELLDSLVSRLGQDAVTRSRFVADPQPELACRFECAVAKAQGFAALTPGLLESVFAHRPLRLLSRPIAIEVVAIAPLGMPHRFHYAGTDHTAVFCQGPERIETGWWRSADVRRDYYMVETKEGTRWWIFRRLDDGRWFLHGCFD